MLEFCAKFKNLYNEGLVTPFDGRQIDRWINNGNPSAAILVIDRTPVASRSQVSTDLLKFFAVPCGCKLGQLSVTKNYEMSIMSGWHLQNSNTEDSDILEPEELQEVMAANGSLMDCVFNPDELYCNYADEIPETKAYIPCAPADTTFIPNLYSHATGHLPCREDYAGPCTFSVLLDGTPSAKNKWAYSKGLNKLYIVWDKIIPVQFTWVHTEHNLVVRALPVYTDAQDMKNPVTRCVLHSSVEEETNDGFDYVSHVIRSENPGAIYEENPESKRCSVVVPLGEPQPGTATVTVTYKFMCKTTCVTGMMRRPITVLFTLERPNGEVIGRQKLHVKICSCPSRDMKKDEESLSDKSDSGNSKRTLSLMEKNVAHRSSKRFKFDGENNPRTLIVQFDDPEIFRKMLEFNHAAATSLLRRTPRTHNSFPNLTEFLNNVEGKMSNPDL